MAERVNATGQLFGHLHSQAWEFFRMGNLEKATELAQRMLPEPRVGDFHRAGFHLIMAFSDDQYVYVPILSAQLRHLIPITSLLHQKRPRAMARGSVDSNPSSSRVHLIAST